MDSEPQRVNPADGQNGGMFLFQGVAIGGPLEELKDSLEKKILRCQSLGETEAAERFRRAYALARAKLEAALAAAKPSGGS
jgi:hypothetical protein